MSVDIRRGMDEQGLITNLGELDVKKFRDALYKGTVDIAIFK